MPPALRTVAAILVSTNIAFAAASAMGLDAGDLPDDAKPLGNEKLLAIYRDKTWIWPDGAGFFAKDGHFVAWSGQGGTAGYAEGRWWVYGAEGQFCFQGSWHYLTRTIKSRICFQHRATGSFIYQKRVPAGAWYIFKNSPTSATDEYQKLQNGDLVQERVDQIKEFLQAKAQQGT